MRGGLAEAYDFFISHASEDKDLVARPLADELKAQGFRVWLDAFELRLGDSLRAKIDEGLRGSRFGVVILSPAFFSKRWPLQELNGLAAREMSGGRKVILPIVHEMSHESVAQYSPLLADRLSVSTARGIPAIAREIIDASGLTPSTAVAKEPARHPREMQTVDPAPFVAARRLDPRLIDSSAQDTAGDVAAAVARASGLLREGRWRRKSGALLVVVACGPQRERMRPSRLEDDGLANTVQQRAAFGRARVLDPRAATTHRIDGDVLVLQQEGSELHVAGDGTVVLLDPSITRAHRASGALGGMVVIEEHVRAQLVAALTFVGDLLDELDPSDAISTVVPVAGMLDPQHMAWRTQAEHSANPNRISPNMFGPERALAQLTPPNRPRAALLGETADLAEDLLVLLRRQLRQQA
jgi:TIR domain-containing protein